METFWLNGPRLYLILAAVVGLALMTAGLAVLLFRRDVNFEAFARTMKKLIDVGNVDRALKLCRAVNCPASTLTYYLLGLEEPAEVMEQEKERQSAGYRDAAVAVRQVPFGERVAMLAEREVDFLRRKHRRHGLAAVVGGLVAFLLGLAAALITIKAPRQLSWVEYAIAVIGLLGAALGARTWHRINAGLRDIAATIVPMLRPVEEMDKQARAEAARAREAHSQRLNPGLIPNG
jgi:hypothetical protein